MATTLPEEKLERLSGAIERITFHNEESGFCVLRAKVPGQRELITLIANVPNIAPGESFEAVGTWANDKRHGLQFKAQELTLIPPTTREGIQKYLASGMVKGIGPHFAKQLIQAFGENVFDVIEKSPERLTELEGIGEKRKDMVLSAWSEQKSIRNIMVFLQSHGIGTARAVRIYKTYGDHAIERVRENPYRLALDIHGIGFKIADALALQLGMPKDSVMRAQAGVQHTLKALCEHGHCAATHEQLIEESMKLLDVSEAIIHEAIDLATHAEQIIHEDMDGTAYVFPAALFHAETAVAADLIRIRNHPSAWEPIDTEKSITWVEKKTGLSLSPSQHQAIQTVIQNKLSIITGGPGVGKTTIVNSILKIFQARKLAVMLCAPTGRAAKRMTETTGVTAKTIHRLLEYDAQTGAFRHNEENPLPLDVLIIDESSMIDIVLCRHLLAAIPDHAAVIFVGDVDQLPSVGPGAVLQDMIRSDVIKTVKLTEIFRQAADSKIITNAHRINQGELPQPQQSREDDFYAIYTDTPEEIRDQLMSIVAERLPEYLKCNPLTDIQVLTPMNRGGLGTHALNAALQQQLNGHAEPKIQRFGITFAPGDKVIQIINNYDKEVFNGDIGTISNVDLVNNSLNVAYDNRTVTYEFNELDEIKLAYAISIHKSQGSEFPIVVIPLSTQHYVLLARNLLYTGVTRGKKMVVLIGQKKAVNMAVNNQQDNQRITRLATRIQQYN